MREVQSSYKRIAQHISLNGLSVVYSVRLHLKVDESYKQWKVRSDAITLKASESGYAFEGIIVGAISSAGWTNQLREYPTHKALVDVTIAAVSPDWESNA